MVTFASRTRLKFEWEGYPDPPDVAFRLAAMEGWFLNTTAFVEASQEIAIRDMDRKFESETDPQGKKWPELKEPAYNQVSILRLTTQMYQDSINPNTWQVTPRGLFFDTTELPPYWIFHEQPQGAGRSRRVPRRSFIPLSAQAQAELTLLFNEWVDQGMIVGARGRIAEFRAPSGRFASFNS